MKKTVKVSNIVWEPYDQTITEEEFEDLVNEQPESLEFEVDEDADIDEIIEEVLYNDNLKVKKYRYEVV